MKQITSFWNYFQKNEKEIINAFFLGINSDEIYSQFIKKLNSISKRIGFEITKPSNNHDKCRIIFTAYGYCKLFPKIIALKNQTPSLEHFTVQAFIKPFESSEEYKNGTDDSTFYAKYNRKISVIQIALLDYNIATKHIKNSLYLPHYSEIKHFADLKDNINWIVMQIVGEITFSKEIQTHQMPLKPIGMLSLIELPNYINYLCKINSKG